MVESPFSREDESRLEQRGIPLAEAERQLAAFARPAAYRALVRPAIVGDGVVCIPDDDGRELLRGHEAAAAPGRFMKFVPASGAATRMFKELLYFQRGPGRELRWSEVRERVDSATEAAALVRFVNGLPRFAFHAELSEAVASRGEDLGELARRGDFQPILEALLRPQGLGYETAPKGLLKFHRYDDGPRTPFEEHLVEAADHTRDRDGTSRLHFTVSSEHRERFAALLRELEGRYAERDGVRFDVRFSEQKPSTDTLAVDLDNRPVRDERGGLVLRPGGHGSLIENLNEMRADLLFVKNIDNVQPDRLKPLTLRWKRLLAGYLVRLQGTLFRHLARLREAEPTAAVLDDVRRFVSRELKVEMPESRSSPAAARDALVDRLDRPLRVCGVVRNTGEPGGGPFWVRDREGTVSLQIVESAEVDPVDTAQQRLLRSSTHFNPVDLVCAVRDSAGRPFDLHRFIDPDAAIVTTKSVAGREIKALERPGLWNGAMAHWNTVFVEVPLGTFSPVKSVADLLRDEHQPG